MRSFQQHAAWVAVAILTAALLLTAHEQGRALLHFAGPLHPYFHVALFGAIAWLAAQHASSVPMRLGICAAVILLGCAAELVEYSLNHTVVEWTDMMLDAMGAVAGTGIGALAFRHPPVPERHRNYR